MKNSSFCSDEFIDVEEKALTLFAEVTSILFSSSADARMLLGVIEALEKEIGEDNFRVVVQLISKGQKEIIVKNANEVIEIMTRTKDLMQSIEVEK